MLPGSLYYHFPSKEDLLLAVHAEGVAHIKRAVEDSISVAADDAWSRLRVACVAHLEALLGGSDYTQVVSPQFPRAFPKPLRTRMISQRDSYETLFAGLVNALPVPSGVDRRHLRLAMLGSLNWTLTWYRPGADTPRRIAEQIVDLYRMQLDPAASARG